MQMEGRQVPTPATPATSHTVVLLVEDEAVVREITAKVLRIAGYVVLETGSPSEALSLAGENRGAIHLLLSDVVMPQMSGIDLAARIRELHPDIAVVFMSGYVGGDILRKATGPAMHIQKPFTVNSLLAQVAEALHRNEPPSNAAPHRTNQRSSLSAAPGVESSPI
jgi:two-component system, cell cycle sensor histidine kinase and response regulator CckA